MRNPKELNPKWRQGTKVAKKILDTTDPGHRYWKAENVQSSAARQSFANRVAFIDILAQAVAPLQPVDDERLYGWLLEGTKAGVMRIHGCTGLSPKLLHTLAQVTHLSALMAEVNNSIPQQYLLADHCRTPSPQSFRKEHETLKRDLKVSDSGQIFQRDTQRQNSS